MASNIQAVSRSRHAGMQWRGSADFRFTADTSLATLAAAEVGHAALALPLAFVARGEHWGLAAVLGFLPEQNLCVDAAGTWLARYVPAAFRAHPFLIGSRPGGEATLCVDEASGLVSQGGAGEPFFTETGELNLNLARVSSFLSETAQSEAVLIQACDLLHRAGVIESWPITLQSEQDAQPVEGLHRINEAKLNALDDATHVQLRRGGALTVAYAQLLSMGNLSWLGRLAQARAQAEARARTSEQAREAPLEPVINLPNDSTIDWDWSKIGR